MSLIGAGASVDLSPLDDVNQIVRGSAALMRTYQKVRERQSRERIRARLKAPQDLPDLPFIWSNDPAAQKRARGYYFAVIVPKGSKGGRHQRTGALEAATNVRFVPDDLGGYFLVENDAEGSEFVIGERQVPSHYLTGWENIDDVVQQEADFMSDQLINDWYFVSTGAGGLMGTTTVVRERLEALMIAAPGIVSLLDRYKDDNIELKTDELPGVMVYRAGRAAHENYSTDAYFTTRLWLVWVVVQEIKNLNRDSKRDADDAAEELLDPIIQYLRQHDRLQIADAQDIGVQGITVRDDGVKEFQRGVKRFSALPILVDIASYNQIWSET